MKLICLLLLVSCVYTEAVQSLERSFPRGRTCGLNYDMVLKDRNWVCNDPRFKNYPGQNVKDAFDSGMYQDIDKYINVTKSCQTYHDSIDIHGSNTYYSYNAICKMHRNPIRVIWTRVPGTYTLTPEQSQWNNGLLPVHVIEGQSLYDIYCVHPWSEGGTLKHLPKGVANRVKRIKWNGLKKHLCKVGYMYNYNYICKPSGFINRKVVVYSEHANLLFFVTIPNVPTSCSCTKCECTGIPQIIG